MIGVLLAGFFGLAIGYDLLQHDYRNALVVGVIALISVVAGVLGART